MMRFAARLDAWGGDATASRLSRVAGGELWDPGLRADTVVLNVTCF